MNNNKKRRKKTYQKKKEEEKELPYCCFSFLLLWLPLLLLMPFSFFLFFYATILCITMMMLRSSTATPLQIFKISSFFYYNKDASQWTPYCSMDRTIRQQWWRFNPYCFANQNNKTMSKSSIPRYFIWFKDLSSFI